MSSFRPYVKHQITGRHVAGDGPLPCDLMLIGDRPDRDDDKYGLPFQGAPGRELDRYLLNLVGRHRSTVRVDLIVRTAAEENRKDKSITKQEVARDEPELMANMARCAPRIIASLGRNAARYFLGDVDMEIVHGRPHTLDSGIVLVPCFNPAAGLRNTEVQAKIAYDFLQLGLVRRGKIKLLHPEPDPYPEPYYHDCYATRLWDGEWAVDTEGYKDNPWGGSMTSEPGTAEVWKQLTIDSQARIILHNSMHDLDVLAALGCPVADDQFDDTMIMSYLLCIEPQGLKELARRHLGMEMQSYDEVLGKANYDKAITYWEKVMEWLDNRLSNA